MIVQGDGTLGRFAVWTDGNDAPWSNPTGNANRVKIHSDLDNAGVILPIRTGTLPNVGTNSDSLNLFAHGQSYAPLILGFLTIGGKAVPINQGVLVPVGSGGVKSVTFGVNQTHVVMNIISFIVGSGTSAPTITYQILVFDVGVNANGTFRRPAKYPGVIFENGVFRCGYISSDRRYLHKISSGQIPLPNGRTISTGVGRTPGANTVGIGFRQSINGHIVQRNATGFGPFAANNSTFNAATTKVAI